MIHFQSMTLLTIDKIIGDLQKLNAASLKVWSPVINIFLNISLSNEMVLPIHVQLVCHVKQLRWLIRGFSGNNPQLLPDQLAHLVCTIVCFTLSSNSLTSHIVTTGFHKLICIFWIIEVWTSRIWYSFICLSGNNLLFKSIFGPCALFPSYHNGLLSKG